MKQILSILLIVGAISLAGCMDSAPTAPGAPGAAAPSDSSVALTGENSEQIEGRVEVHKEAGKADMVHFKTSDNKELELLPSKELAALLKTEGLEQKTFVLEGEKVASSNGRPEGFLIRSFEASSAAASKSESDKSTAQSSERL